MVRDEGFGEREKSGRADMMLMETVAMRNSEPLVPLIVTV